MYSEQDKKDFVQKIEWAKDAINKAEELFTAGGDPADVKFWLVVASTRVKSWEFTGQKEFAE